MKREQVEISASRVLYGVVVGIALLILVERFVTEGVAPTLAALWSEKGK
jgi:uncharacterized membrane protein YgaE (UPF0421/DUF939 family)